MRTLVITTAISAIALASVDVAAQRGGRGRDTQATFKFLAKKYDRNKDGKITWKEYKRDRDKFKQFDSNSDGSITHDDFSGGGRGRGRGGRGGGGGGRSRGSVVPKEGTVAPDFNLPLAKDRKKRVKLSSFKGKQPVALIFGSYT